MASFLRNKGEWLSHNHIIGMSFINYMLTIYVYTYRHAQKHCKIFITVLLSHLQLKYLRVHIDNEKTFLLMQCFGVRGEGELKWRNCILSSWQSLLQILYYFHACIIHRKRQWYELYVQYMEIYDKTHIKFTESKEENKSQKKKRKSTLYQNFCLFMYSSYLKELS